MDSIGKAARVERVQAELWGWVPPDYAAFLVRYGHAETGGLTIYVYSPNWLVFGVLFFGHGREGQTERQTKR